MHRSRCLTVVLSTTLALTACTADPAAVTISHPTVVAVASSTPPPDQPGGRAPDDAAGVGPRSFDLGLTGLQFDEETASEPDPNGLNLDEAALELDFSHLDFGEAPVVADPAWELGRDDLPLAAGNPEAGFIYVGLCPALEDVVGDTVNDVDAAMAAIRASTPSQWHGILDASAGDPRVTPVGFTAETINALDGYYFDECEVPLFAGSALLDLHCRGSRVCVRPAVQAILGGVCFEELAAAQPLRAWIVLSCVSGLPA